MSWSRPNHANIIRKARNSLLVAGLCLLGAAKAQTEIHKCTDADGGIVFSQLPCAPQESIEPGIAAPEEQAETAEALPEYEYEYDEAELFVAEAGEDAVSSDADREACQKPIRDAIDAIDAEIGREYSAEKAGQYKQRLLELTGKLRQC